MAYRNIWLATSCLFGLTLACGTNVDSADPANTPAASEAATEVAFNPKSAATVPLEPYLIDRVELGGHVADFIQVYTEENGVVDASVMMIRTGPEGQNPTDQLQQRFDVPLTMAEVYMGLKGVGAEALPSELAISQIVQARELGRTSEFAQPARLAAAPVEKALDPVFFPVIPAHHWTEARQENRSLASANPKYACTGVPVAQGFIFDGGGVFVNSCRTEWNRRGWIRVAAKNTSNSANKTQVVQQCYGPSTSGTWACAVPEVFNQNFYKIADWTNNSLKRMSLVVNCPVQAGYAATYASGISTPN